FNPFYLALDRDGGLYITEIQNNRIRRVGADGIIITVAGTGELGFSGNDGPATLAQIRGVRGITFAPDGSFVFADTGNLRLRRVGSAWPGFPSSDIAAEDGSEIYQFDAVGRHLRTLHALTGAPLYSLSYDAAGRLTQITDGDGNVTTIEHDGNGNPTA